MTDRHQIWGLLDGIQMDLRAGSAKIVALRSFAAGLDLPSPSEVTCPHCGVPCKGPRTLAEHIHNLHDGPIPEHWRELDSQVADESRAHARPSPDPDAALTSEGT